MMYDKAPVPISSWSLPWRLTAYVTWTVMGLIWGAFLLWFLSVTVFA